MDLNDRIRLQVSESKYPPTMLWTLESMDNLGELLYGSGDYVGPEKVFRDLESKRIDLLTSRHPDTIRTKVLVANSLYYASNSMSLDLCSRF